MSHCVCLILKKLSPDSALCLVRIGAQRHPLNFRILWCPWHPPFRRRRAIPRRPLLDRRYISMYPAGTLYAYRLRFCSIRSKRLLQDVRYAGRQDYWQRHIRTPTEDFLSARSASNSYSCPTNELLCILFIINRERSSLVFWLGRLNIIRPHEGTS